MALIINKPALRAIPSAGYAGVVHQCRFEFTMPANFVVGDIIEIGALPAYARICGAIFDADAQEGMVVDVGIMSGTVGANDPSRTCGNEFWDDLAVNGPISGLTTTDALRVKQTDVDRGIGIKVVTNATALVPGASLNLELAYHY